ncbi:MAG: class B sortase [Oscillospiraceae bacterium]|nr:class B sortase [Oscillospiraceae bacterium]
MSNNIKNRPDAKKANNELNTEENASSVYIKKIGKINKIIFWVSVSVLAICLIIIIAVLISNANKPIPDPGREWLPNTIVKLSAPSELPDMESDEDEDATVLIDWEEMHARNNHFVGWLKIGDTVVDYPVMQFLEDEFDHMDTLGYTGNSYYLKRDFDRNYSDLGSLFVDWHTPIVNKKRPDNAVIYGHNMSSGAGFAYLVNYFTEPGGKDLSAAYYNNPTIDFTTVYEKERSTYKIFATMYLNINEEHGEVFNYYQRRYFDTKGEFYDYIGDVMDRSVFYTDVDIEYGDELLTLSTCFFPFGRDIESRVVVIARRVREGEDPSVDTSSAYVNPSPRYFDLYYSRQGGEWGGRSWDTSKVKGFDEFYNF